jgi:NADH-quinone oxidoreductase subunit J
MIASLIFYLFAGVLVASAICVVALNNPVHSVLFLILSFFNASALFLLIGAEYLGLILLIIYIGAVAVLFLFVVMMLDIEIIAARSADGGRSFFPVAMIIGSIVFIELLAVFAAWTAGPDMAGNLTNLPGENVGKVSAISAQLYTDYIVLFQGSGLILLVAMIGAITLAMRKRGGTRQQDIREQTETDSTDAVEMVNVKPGQGV